MIVAVVLKTGGWRNRTFRVEYTPAHVRWVRDMVAKHLTIPHEFVCLSDVDIEGVCTVPFRHDWAGWWGKIELFRHDLFVGERVFYLDLDTVIVDNINHIVGHDHKFTTLRNMSSPKTDRIGSGVMAWHGDLSEIYKTFRADPDMYMRKCQTSECWGDQGFIQPFARKCDRFQDLFPNEIVSFKTNLNHGDPAPENKIVCFHGLPKPQEIKRSWIPDFNP